jgi:predicted nucleotidyltransferase
MASMEWWKIKQGKESTPMDHENSTYPIKCKADMGPLLRRRIGEIADAIKDEYKCSSVSIWLFGSQLRGRSAKGSPDIDIHWYCREPHVTTMDRKVLDEHRNNILRKLAFKVDMNYANRAGKVGAINVY